MCWVSLRSTQPTLHRLREKDVRIDGGLLRIDRKENGCADFEFCI
jgi:hypothetical protein